MQPKREWARKTATGALWALALAASPGVMAAAGQAAFDTHCRTCHSPRRDDNRLGPSLYGVVGAKAGSVAGYSGYSQGLRDSAIVWDERTLDRFMADPEAVVPNNNMKPFGGIPDAAVRALIIEFLRRNASRKAA